MRALSRIILGLLLVTPAVVRAQDLGLFPPNGDNQKASVSQNLGLVRVTIDYSSPKVVRGTNDRRGKIYGTLVPYGMQKTLGFGNCTQCPWRGGANEMTHFTVSHDVKIEGQPLAAGVYGLHFIPDPAEWTVIFSKETASWGSFFYDPKDDALRVKVKPQKSEYHEYLTYEFPDREIGQATAMMRWEDLAVPFKITVDDPNGLYIENLRSQLRGPRGFDWHNQMAAAQFAMENKIAPADALQWAQRAVDGTFVGNENFQTLTTLAQAQEANGMAAESARTYDRAMNRPDASAADLHAFGRQLQLAGKNEEAMKVFELNARRHPNVWPVNVGLARGNASMGRKAAALKFAKLALAQAPDEQNRKNVEAMIKTLEEGKELQ